MKTLFPKKKTPAKTHERSDSGNIIELSSVSLGSRRLFKDKKRNQLSGDKNQQKNKDQLKDSKRDIESNAFKNSHKDWVFLFPTMHAQDGGYLAQQRFSDIARALSNLPSDSREIDSVSIATYEKKQPDYLWLDNLLKPPAHKDKKVYCIHYGPHVSSLFKKLKGRRVIYFAHSIGWSIKPPRDATIVSVSKHCLGYWSKKNPGNAQFYLPNIIDDKFSLPKPLQDYSMPKRTNDVLVIKRKMSSYLLDELLPQLQGFLRVKVVDEWNPAIEDDMKASKLFLYDSSSYWKKHKATEGFGLPPLEAMACGCTVFSSLNDGLADFLDPAINCTQLHPGNKQRDIENIFNCIREWQEPAKAHSVVDNYRSRKIMQRFSTIAAQINKQHSSDEIR